MIQFWKNKKSSSDNPHSEFRLYVVLVTIMSGVILSASPVTAAVNDNLDAAFVKLSEWLGIGKESSTPTASNFNNATLVEKVNYLEDKLDSVFQSASNGKTLLASKAGMTGLTGTPTFKEINDFVVTKKSSEYNSAYNSAYNSSYSSAYTRGYNEKKQTGYDEGYAKGCEDGIPKIPVPTQRDSIFEVDGCRYFVYSVSDGTARVIWMKMLGSDGKAGSWRTASDYNTMRNLGYDLSLEGYQVLAKYFTVENQRMINSSEKNSVMYDFTNIWLYTDLETSSYVTLYGGAGDLSSGGATGPLDTMNQKYCGYLAVSCDISAK